MKKKILRGVSCLLVASILCQGAVTVDAGAKAGLADKKMSVYVKKSKKIVIKNKKKKAKYTFRSSDKKVAKVSAKGVVKALKVGTAKITVKESYKGKTRKVGTVKISCVAKAAKVSEAPANTPVVTPTPTVTPVQTTEPIQTATPTLTPVPTPVPTPTVTPEPPIELREITADMPKGFDQKQDGVSYGSVVKKKYFSTTTNKNRNVNIILPADYTTEKEYPVLYLFHGIGGDEDEWLQGKPQYIVGNLIAQGLAKEMIIVIPNCRARENDKAVTEFSLDHYAAFDNFINDLRDNLMPYMEDNYSIATGRKNTAIAGLSMGGRESLNIGLHMPETFGYIAAFSPGMGVFEYTANGVHEEGLFTEDTFLLPEEYKFNTLLMLNNGISEGGENAIGGQCHRALEKNDIPHIFYVTEGGHDFKVWKHGLYNFALQIFQ